MILNWWGVASTVRCKEQLVRLPDVVRFPGSPRLAAKVLRSLEHKPVHG
jgi:hypothetical protein